ncbi:MAG: hypothetical protein P9X24_18890 [Candidatus Hatepunaea meridiana]|nr:hypothetical protein [Candidatus Hatepunaea meridiana]
MEIVNKIKPRLAALRKRIKNQPRLYPHLADCYMQVGMYKSANKELAKGLEMFPSDIVGWLVKGKLHLKQNQSDLAYAAYEQVLKIDNDTALAHEKCAELAEQENDTNKFIHHLAELKRLVPLDNQAQIRMENAYLRKIAVEEGFYQRNRVLQVPITTLRQLLLEHNLLPEKLIRKTGRVEDVVDEGAQPKQETNVEVIEELPEYAQEQTPDLADTTDQDELLVQSEDIAVDELFSPVIEDEPVQPDSTYIPEPATSDEVIKTEHSLFDINEQPIEQNFPGIEEIEETSIEIDEPLEAESNKFEIEEELMLQDVQFKEEQEQPEQELIEELKSGSPKSETAPPMIMQPEMKQRRKDADLVRREGIHRRLARMAREITSAPPPITEAIELPKSAPDNLEQKPAPPMQTDVGAPDDQTAIKEEATQLPPTIPEEPIEDKPRTRVHTKSFAELFSKQPRGRIPTKTLAELYASQGDYSRAIEVYQELYSKSPDNTSFIDRIESLQAKLMEGS